MKTKNPLRELESTQETLKDISRKLVKSQRELLRASENYARVINEAMKRNITLVRAYGKGLEGRTMRSKLVMNSPERNAALEEYIDDRLLRTYGKMYRTILKNAIGENVPGATERQVATNKDALDFYHMNPLKFRGMGRGSLDALENYLTAKGLI